MKHFFNSLKVYTLFFSAPIAILFAIIIFFFHKKVDISTILLEYLKINGFFFILILMITFIRTWYCVNEKKMRHEITQKLKENFEAVKLSANRYQFKLHGFTIIIQHHYKIGFRDFINHVSFLIPFPEELPSQFDRKIAMKFNCLRIKGDLFISGRQSITFNLNIKSLKKKIMKQVKELEEFIASRK